MPIVAEARPFSGATTRSEQNVSPACAAVDPELFFPIGNTGPFVEQIERAKAVCRRCPIREACLDAALERDEEFGVWGGLSEVERRAMKRRLQVQANSSEVAA